MKTIAIIPARYSSTRLKHKVLLDIAGKPMIVRVHDQVKQATLIQDVFVATDDQRIAKVITDFGGKAIMTSPAHQSGTDRIAEVAAKVEADVVVNVQGDEPLISPQMIDQAINGLIEDKSTQMGTLKRAINDVRKLIDPNVVKVVTDKDGFALYFSRLPIPYSRDEWNISYDSNKEYVTNLIFRPTALHYEHIGLYVYRKDFLLKLTTIPPTPLERLEKLEQLRVLDNGYKIRVIETDYDSYSVDTEEDLEIVRGIINHISHRGTKAQSFKGTKK